jgi:hypothetical protein
VGNNARISGGKMIGGLQAYPDDVLVV